MLTACGVLPEAAATQTAADWTPTPVPPTATPTPLPTPTATPVPYNVRITLKNAEGEPIADALVMLDAGEGLEARTDESGTAAFGDLPGETFTVKAAAQGYFAAESQQSIVRGENQVDLVLERDPYGLLPSQACAAGETPLMIEDLQDQTMQGWGDLSAKLASGVPGIEIVQDPEQPGNWVLRIFSLGEGSFNDVGGYDQPLGDAVVRFRVLARGRQHYHLNWHNSPAGRYVAFIYGEPNAFGGRLDKFVGGEGFTALQFPGSYGDEKWHFFEISTYQGEFQIWIDGVERGRGRGQKSQGGQTCLSYRIANNPWWYLTYVGIVCLYRRYAP
ncbi:MAG: carboxypeptidase regulatory-like domain-containing protein [Anaerolineae bacterium]|nr:carboxypeptidase regulatory-like domain-containing protein [Anaerolineae bacterium]